MLENINYALFALLNATPASPQWAIEMAIFIAKDLILIVPLLVVTLWLWGPAQRQMVFKLMLALTISLTRVVGDRPSLSARSAVCRRRRL